MDQIKEYTLFEIAKQTDSKVVGDENFVVNNLATLKSSNKSSISFFASPKYKMDLKRSRAKAIIAHDSFEINDDRNYLLSSDPYLTSVSYTHLRAHET